LSAAKIAGVAQLVEQRIRNAKVGCSIHLTGTKSPLEIKPLATADSVGLVRDASVFAQ
jgi:hypothetical protein